MSIASFFDKALSLKILNPASDGDTRLELRDLCVDNRGAMDFNFTPEQKAFQDAAEGFARDVVAPRAAAIDASGEFPSDVIRAAASLGLHGATVSRAWGGAGRDYLSYALAIEAIGRADAVACFVECATR